ncbi:hypothetical protein [Acinetobacter sp. ANC 4648]|uniref:hypothetical protein n=1 Tax=Acinetobacter sp. ANC 4648 TaxID=1977875 RepID=UPI000A32C932|nr:hypothetical protein [Acinetobacter sp. ANC 4648]OTG82179.1 hypothetical protein B9T27_07960 [Acinetobacter sp. ANC 4648]
MKNRISFDFAVVSTLLSGFIFLCGFFYLDSYVGFFDYHQSALGFNFQDYLMYGWINSLTALSLCFIAFIVISLVNTLYQKDLYKSFIKGLVRILTFPFVFLYNLFIKWLLIRLIYLLKIFFEILFYIALLPLKCKLIYKISAYLGSGIKFFLNFIVFNRLKSAFNKTLVETGKFTEWKETEDNQNMDLIAKDVIIHYFYLILFYLLLLVGLYFLINIGKNAQKQAITEFNNDKYSLLIIKDELIETWLTNKNYKINYPIKIKIILCGSQKCLIAIPFSEIKNPNPSQIILKTNFLVKTIDPNNYIVIK